MIFGALLATAMFIGKLVGLKVVYPKAIPYTKPVPPPTDRIPDVETFLKEIGRGCINFASKFTSWNDLFESTGKVLKERDIPIVYRKYILKWTEQFRQGMEPIEFPLGPKEIKKRKYPN